MSSESASYPEQQSTNTSTEKKAGMASVVFLVVGTLWSLIGFIAFITSIVCVFKNSTLIENVIGLLLSIFLGPLYFFFFFLSSTYCSSK
jgi:uncharacterized protein YacL